MTAPSPDFYAIEELLEPAEIEIRDRVRAFCEEEVTPTINDYWDRGLLREVDALGEVEEITRRAIDALEDLVRT